MDVLTIDYGSPEAPSLFDRSLRTTGFAVIKNHPVSATLMKEFYSEWALFFRDPAKFDYRFDPVQQSGYFPFQMENAKNSPYKDLKEFFHIYPSTPLPKGIGPSSHAVKSQLTSLASEMLHWLDLELPTSIRQELSMPLSKMIEESPTTLLRVLHYPPIPESAGSPGSGPIRAGAHEDINLITLLPAATMPGLQVRDLNQQWHDVPCDPGTIVVNSGDMLQLATQGYYPSTTHRVINPTGEEALESRYSTPLFLHPRPEVVLWNGLTAGEYLHQRLVEIGLK